MARGTIPFSYAVRNLTRTPGRMALSISGTVLVVLLVLAAGGFVNGMQRALVASGSASNVILLGAGSEESLERSEIPMRSASILGASIDGIASAAGVEAVSPEIHLAMPISTDAATDARGDGTLTVLRGITPAAWIVHTEARLLHGRVGETGRNEAVIGRMAARAMGFEPAESAIGESVFIDGTAIMLTGVLAGDGGVIEGELWYPLTDLQVLAQRDSISCVLVRRDTASAAEFQAFAARRLDLELVALNEQEYFATLSQFYLPIQVMVIVTAVLIALGGVLGGLNSAYASFASRVRELGTLQTLGYTRRAVAWSLVQESVLASSIGALIACGIGMAILDGQAIRFSMGIFGLSIDAAVLTAGLLAGIGLGILGALIPAWRCLSLPIPEALRTTV